MEFNRRYTDITELKKKIVEKNIKTTSNLAQLTGINRNTLGKILSGEIQPSSDSMFRLSDVLEISPEESGKIFFAINLRNT